MNPDRIYRAYRDEAFAKQATGKNYSTFVAMPFHDRFSYRASSIHQEVFCKAADLANDKNETKRQFSPPKRVDQGGGQALEITEEIVIGILESHFFLGDLSFENAGVLLEAGIAFGLKPTPHIVLVTQGLLSDLHFDIRNNKVIPYNDANGPDLICRALIAAAVDFETRVDSYLAGMKERLTPQSMICLSRYVVGQLANRSASLHDGLADTLFGGYDARSVFYLATRELLDKGLLRTEFGAIPKEGRVDFGMHATDLGRLLISFIWPDEARKLDWI